MFLSFAGKLQIVNTISSPANNKMIIMNTPTHQLKEKLAAYNLALENTLLNRKSWSGTIKEQLRTTLEGFLAESGMKGKIIENTDMENLESITLDLGRISSGIAQTSHTDDIKNFMIKNNGALIYQQLFNGKIMVMVQHPHIEGYGEPKEPQFLEIITPGEVSAPVIYEHLENLLDIITEWEDYDDESPQKKTAFQPIGFQHTVTVEKPD